MAKNKPEPTTAPPVAPKFAKHKTILCQLVETPYGEMGIPAQGSHPDAQSICSHNLPPIPLDTFYAILCWQRKIAKEHQCETTTSLFLIDGEWVAEPFFQANEKGSMTADIDYSSDENKDIFEALSSKSENGIHATIHNHVNSSAHQSGRDADDEMGLPGPHITLGNMQQMLIDYHGRFSVWAGGSHHFIPMRLSDIVELPLPSNPSWGQIELVEKAILSAIPDYGYPKDWDTRFTVKARYTPGKPITPSKPYSGQQNTGSSADLYNKLVELNHEDIDLDKAPWAAIVHLNCKNWVDFKTGYQDQMDALKKPMVNIQSVHECSLHAIYLALYQSKTALKIPLDKAPLRPAKK